MTDARRDEFEVGDDSELSSSPSRFTSGMVCGMCGIDLNTVRHTLNTEKSEGDDPLLNSVLSSLQVLLESLSDFQWQNKSRKLCKSCAVSINDFRNSKDTMVRTLEKLKGGGILTVEELALTESEKKFCYNCKTTSGTLSSCASKIKHPGEDTIADAWNVLRIQSGLLPLHAKYTFVGSFHFCKPCVGLLKEYFDANNLYQRCSSKFLDLTGQFKMSFKQQKMDTEQIDEPSYILTEEDTDPFAVMPKLEPHQEDCGCSSCRPESSYSPCKTPDTLFLPETSDHDSIRELSCIDETVDQPNLDNCSNNVTKCIICNKPSDAWLRKWASQRNKLAESLCKLLGLPSIPYENQFSEAPYCFTCQKKIFEVQQIFKNLEKLQELILEMRNEFEAYLGQSSLEVQQLSEELLRSVSEEQLRVNEARSKIVNRLGLSGTTDIIETEPDPVDCVTVNYFESPLVDDATVSKTSTELNPEIEPNLDDLDSDSDWDPPGGPISVPYSDDSDYKPSFTKARGNVERVTRRTAALKRGISEIEASDIKKEQMEESEDSDNEVVRKKRKVGRKVKQGSVMVVQLEKLTGDNFREAGVNVKRRRGRKPKKTAISKSTTSKTLEESKQISKKQLDFGCEQCPRRFVSEVKREAHVKRLHEGIDRPYACDHPGCEKTYKRVGELKSHKTAHSTEKPFMCDVCGKACKTAGLLEFHQKNMHDAGGRAFKCDKCDRSFITPQKLKMHDVTHTKVYPVICEICGKGFTQRQFLEVHVAAKHQEVNPYKCEVENCGKTFAHPMNLQQHQYIHTGNYPFKCPECGLGAVTKYHLKKHVRSIHTDERPFECNICHKSFPYTHSLKKHMMSHAGMKEFACDECDKKFIDNYKLQRHKRIHRGERPYQCHICSKCFYTKDYLNIHIGYHNKAAEQGKGTINQAKIHRLLKPGVSGARDSSSKKKQRSMDKINSNDNEVLEDRKSPTHSNSNDIINFSQQQQLTTASTTFTPIIVSSTAVTASGSTYSTHSGEVFFQGEFYPIFP